MQSTPPDVEKSLRFLYKATLADLKSGGCISAMCGLPKVICAVTRKMEELWDMQDEKKKRTIFKQSLWEYENMSGVKIQRIPASYLKRILRTIEEDDDDDEYGSQRDEDAVVDAIADLDRIFRRCKDVHVDMLSSAEAVVEEFREDGSKGCGCLLLAWKSGFDSQARRKGEPQLVGAAVLNHFKECDSFATTSDYLSDHDHAILRPYFRLKTMYIDTLCSKGAGGVGKVLMLHAMQYALSKKCDSLIALSYMHRSPRNAADRPESYKLFNDIFRFERLISRATFKRQGYYGTWFFMALDELPFPDLLRSAISVCTRRGFTEKTAGVMIARCPS